MDGPDDILPQYTALIISGQYGTGVVEISDDGTRQSTMTDAQGCVKEEAERHDNLLDRCCTIDGLLNELEGAS